MRLNIILYDYVYICMEMDHFKKGIEVLINAFSASVEEV